MITLSATSCIDAPPQAVWKQLAELEGISQCARSFDEPIATALSRAGSALSGHVSSLAASPSEPSREADRGRARTACTRWRQK